MASIVKAPVFVDLDRRREVVFNLNAEVLIQNAGKRDATLWTKIGEKLDEKTGKVKDTLDLNLENLRVFLWAALHDDMRAHGEILTLEEVGALINSQKRVTSAFLAVRSALDRYYGRDDSEPGK